MQIYHDEVVIQTLFSWKLISFQIEGHALTVIATDAVSVLPKVVDTIITHAGERYDAVINIPPKCDACEGNKSRYNGTHLIENE